MAEAESNRQSTVDLVAGGCFGFTRIGRRRCSDGSQGGQRHVNKPEASTMAAVDQSR